MLLNLIHDAGRHIDAKGLYRGDGSKGKFIRGFECYEESGAKMYRIWVKDGSLEQKEGLLPGEIKSNGY